MPSVAARYASPLEVVCPFSVFVSVETERSIGFPRPPSTLLLAEPSPWRVSRHRAVVPFQALDHPLLGFHSPPGFDRRSPQRRERSRDRSFLVDAVPLMGSCPLQRSPARRIREPRAPPPARCVFRVRTSLDALLPFEPSSHFWPGRSWAFNLQGLAPPSDTSAFRRPRALLTLSAPTTAR